MQKNIIFISYLGILYVAIKESIIYYKKVKFNGELNLFFFIYEILLLFVFQIFLIYLLLACKLHYPLQLALLLKNQTD